MQASYIMRDEFEGRMRYVLDALTGMEDRLLAGIDTKLAEVAQISDTRFDSLEEDSDDIDERLNDLDQHAEVIEARLAERMDHFEERLDRIEQKMDQMLQALKVQAS